MIADKVRSEMVQGQNRFMLDLGHVRYIDSAGLGELIHAFAAVRNRGGALKLMNVTKRVNELLVLTRLLTVFECFDDEASALASFPAVSRVRRVVAATRRAMPQHMIRAIRVARAVRAVRAAPAACALLIGLAVAGAAGCVTFTADAPTIRARADGLLEIAGAPAGTVVRYTLDGTEPTRDAGVWLAPVELPAGYTVKARAFTSADHAAAGARQSSGRHRRKAPAPASRRRSCLSRKAATGASMTGRRGMRRPWR